MVQYERERLCGYSGGSWRGFTIRIVSILACVSS